MKKLTIETLNTLRDEQKKLMEVRITAEDIVNTHVSTNASNTKTQDKE